MSTSPLSNEALLLALRHLRINLISYDRGVAEAADLKESDLTVLEVLHLEGPRTPTALARRTNTHLATMTGVLTRLEKEGWIERHPDATDRRSIRVHATSVERLNGLYADGIGRLYTVFEQWPTEQTEAFLSAIDDINRAMEAPAARK